MYYNKSTSWSYGDTRHWHWSFDAEVSADTFFPKSKNIWATPVSGAPMISARPPSIPSPKAASDEVAEICLAPALGFWFRLQPQGQVWLWHSDSLVPVWQTILALHNLEYSKIIYTASYQQIHRGMRNSLLQTQTRNISTNADPVFYSSHSFTRWQQRRGGL